MIEMFIIVATVSLLTAWQFKRVAASRLADTIAAEESLKAGIPEKCTKCGNSEKSRSGQFMTNAPPFHDPNFRARLVLKRIPEHLSYACWNCGHKEMGATESHK